MSQPGGAFTDLYEFTMVQSYLEHGMTGDAVFDLHVRSLPPGRGYLVAAGLGRALSAIRGFSFTDGDLAYLQDQGLSDELLDYLDGFAFTGTVRAVPEGRLVFPYEPLLQVEAPLPEAQLLETVVLNAVHLETLLATKAARCYTQAPDATLVDFGARRAHGPDAARAAARCSYLGGFAGTSLVEAARDLDIPCFGTMAHSYVLAFEEESDALAAFARSFPDGTTLLIDTYDTVEGARKVVDIARDLEAEGVAVGGVRLDSGDLADLADKVRRILDGAGLDDVRIIASGGLDEHELRELEEGGARIDGYGIGTALTTSRDHPSLDMSYKLASYDGEPVMKLSQEKQTLPGLKQVHRQTGDDGELIGDVLARWDEDAPGEPLLGEVDLDEDTDLHAARERFLDEIDRLPVDHMDIEDPATYPVERSQGIEDLIKEARSRI